MPAGNTRPLGFIKRIPPEILNRKRISIKQQRILTYILLIELNQDIHTYKKQNYSNFCKQIKFIKNILCQ